MSRPEIIVGYHADCYDGLGAAHFARKFLELSEQVAENPRSYLPVNYHMKTPAHYPPRDYPPGALIIFVDFCPDLAVIHDLVARGSTVLILDHHQTSKAACAKISELSNASERHPFSLIHEIWTHNLADGRGSAHVIFDMERSGAGIAHDFFWGPGVLPETEGARVKRLYRLSKGERSLLAGYLEDRDLWRYQLPDSREINAAIQSMPQDFPTMVSLERRLESLKGRQELALEGRAILRYQGRVIGQAVNRRLKTVVIFDGARAQNVTFINASSLMSEIGNAILERNLTTTIAVVYVVDFETRRIGFSLRSLPAGSADCSVLAKLWGGGGHRTASGANVALDEGMKILTKHGVYVPQEGE